MKWRVKQAGAQSWHTHLKWLRPGLGVKRWLLLLTFGVGFLSLGGAIALRSVSSLPSYLNFLTLQALPLGVRIALFIGIGAGMLAFSLWSLNRAVIRPLAESAPSPLPDLLYDHRRKGRGPKIVVIGGGHGQATVLRGLKAYTSNLTAIVTVADDGGSSGRLRHDLGILPPGDFRNCIAALADDESLVTRLFQYRFAGGADLRGHSFGNLFIGALAGVTGTFESALKESSRVLAVQGRVLPSTLQAVMLCADIQRAGAVPVRVKGESEIPKHTGRIVRVVLEPAAPRAYPEVIRAILEADLIVVGPGSLYTSILPNLLVPEITEALYTTHAPKVYVCNVATQRGETEGYTAKDHVDALEQHLGHGVITKVVINTDFPAVPPSEGVQWVEPDLEAKPGLEVLGEALADATVGWRHDSMKLAQVLMSLLNK